MTKRELKAALAEAEALRDEWCREYARLRKEIRRLVKRAAR
jgi:hypothetical protein